MNMIAPIEAPDTDAPVLAPPRRRWPLLAGGALLATVAAGVFVVEKRPASAQAAPPPPIVTVAAPLARDVTEWDDYVGRFAPSQTVEVRPRVSGPITAIHFRDGEIVRRGQPLFTIDRRPFAAALAEARAGIASAASSLALAQADLARANRLTGEEGLSTGEMDTLRARVQAAAAAVAAARARAEQRALDLEFTQVRAPIGGRISDRRADIGNLVSGEGAGATLLTTINALDPIYFSFDGSEALYLKALRNRQAGSAAPIEVRLQDEAAYRWRGRLDFTDNGLDPRSGTMRGRAVISNPDLFLTPGMFGNMRLASGGRARALLVPDSAVQTDQARKTLLVVDSGGSVAAKAVVLGPVVDGLRIVRSGLAPADQVVINGTQLAVPGGKVRPRLGRIDAVADAAPAATSMSLPGEATFAR
jgi:RND family efflux transporter MFP subunit